MNDGVGRCVAIVPNPEDLYPPFFKGPEPMKPVMTSSPSVGGGGGGGGVPPVVSPGECMWVHKHPVHALVYP